MRRSILCATRAFAQNPRPIAVHSSLTSQHTSLPSSGSASATHSALYPVNVPISIARFAPIAWTSSAMSWPCSGEICMPADGSLAVAARSSASTSGSRSECSRRYLRTRSAIPQVRRDILSAQKESVRGVARLVDVRVAELGEEPAELAHLARRHLHADEHPPVVRALVAVVEQADVPVRAHVREELHQRAGPLGELEAIEELVLGQRPA